MPIAKYEPHELLSLMRLPQHEGVYVLGCFERRVTFYSQQVRAINLAFSLENTEELTSDTQIAIIGGGSASLTLAAALLEWTPVSILILEKHSHIMPIQRTCQHRSLHPHLYDWPAEGSLNPDADLPFLTWYADTAEGVVTQIADAWNALAVQHANRIEVSCGCEDLRLVLNDRGGTLSWNGDKGLKTRSFPLIVLAVGYGTEPSALPSQTSYWAGDDLDWELNPAKKWLVSGCGDGGLADVLRLSLRDAAKISTLAWLVGDVTTDPYCQKLLQIESSNDRTKVHAAYSELFEPVARKMHDKLRPLDVTLNAATQHPFGSYASILNRFLVSQLNQMKKVRYRPGKFTDWVDKDGRANIRFDDARVEIFDRVVKRYGPNPALATDFSEIWSRFEAQRIIWQQIPFVLDRSRIPMWHSAEAQRRARVESVHVPLTEARPAGAPPHATSQPFDEVTDETIAADVFASVTVPPDAKPLHIELEISALNTTRRNLPLSHAYGLTLKTATGLHANDAYGELAIEYVDGEVLVSFKDRPDVPAGGSYRWRLSVQTESSFTAEDNVITGVYTIRPQQYFQDVKVRLHTFWYDFVFVKPKGHFHWLREYRIIQSNNRGLRSEVANHRNVTRCSFNQFQLGAGEDFKIHFTCLYQPPPLPFRLVDRLRGTGGGER